MKIETTPVLLSFVPLFSNGETRIKLDEKRGKRANSVNWTLFCNNASASDVGHNARVELCFMVRFKGGGFSSKSMTDRPSCLNNRFVGY